jgi:mono/diheme cytochrome c family protein
MELKKKVLPLLFSAACSAVMLSACSAMPEGNATDGERWFKLYRCIGCHGKGGSGGRGPVIAGISLSQKKFLHKLRNPRSAVMPTFTSQHVSDQDAADIYTWLKQQKK